ncbi:unnamed protein product [Amoebophrya sp. A120]|nr:unnamed protein product [Amoebophrya sp. A120]|eukprot:GSA120T00014862001.1
MMASSTSSSSSRPHNSPPPLPKKRAVFADLYPNRGEHLSEEILDSLDYFVQWKLDQAMTRIRATAAEDKRLQQEMRGGVGGGGAAAGGAFAYNPPHRGPPGGMMMQQPPGTAAPGGADGIKNLQTGATSSSSARGTTSEKSTAAGGARTTGAANTRSMKNSMKAAPVPGLIVGGTNTNTQMKQQTNASIDPSPPGVEQQTKMKLVEFANAKQQILSSAAGTSGGASVQPQHSMRKQPNLIGGKFGDSLKPPEPLFHYTHAQVRRALARCHDTATESLTEDLVAKAHKVNAMPIRTEELSEESEDEDEDL